MWGPYVHHAHGEALEVGLVLGLGQLGLVVEALDLELLAHVDGGGVAVALDGDDGNDVEGLDHVGGDAVLLGEVGLVLEGLEGDVVVGSVGGNGRHDAGPLVHADRQQREGVDLVVRGIGRAEGQAQELVAGEGFEAGDLAEFLGVVLTLFGVEQLAGQAAGRPGAHDEDLVGGIDVVRPVLAGGEDEAVGLAVHGFGPEGGGDEVDGAVAVGGLLIEEGLDLAVAGLVVFGREDLELDEDVLLRADALPLAPVVIGAHLPVEDGVDVVALPVQHLALGPEGVELPPDEGVVVRVDGRGDEGPAPVDAGAKLLHVVDADGGEVVEPVQRVDELGDLFLRDHLLQDVPLPHDARAGLLDQLGLAPLGLLVRRGRGGLGRGGGGHLGLHLGPDLRIVLGKPRRDAVRLGLHLELVGGGLDGHAGAVEGEGEQHVLAAVALELRPEDGLGQAEGVADVQHAVHVRVRERHDELVVGTVDARLAVLGVGLVGLPGLPHGLDLGLVGEEGVALGRALPSSGWG